MKYLLSSPRPCRGLSGVHIMCTDDGWMDGCCHFLKSQHLCSSEFSLCTAAGIVSLNTAMEVKNVFFDKTAKGHLHVCSQTFDHITRCSFAWGVLSQHRLKDIKKSMIPVILGLSLFCQLLFLMSRRNLTVEIFNLLAFQTAIINVLHKMLSFFHQCE